MKALLRSKKICMMLILVIIPFVANAEKTPLEKWNAMAEEVDTWADGVGLGLDEGIKEVVIGLNLLGIKTNQSCEGHLDRGFAYPWINFMFDFNTAKIQKLEEHLIVINFQIDSSGNKAESSLHQLYEEYFEILKSIEKEKLTIVNPLHDLLKEFYKSHSVAFGSTLLLKRLNPSGFYELSSNSANWQIVLDPKEKAQKLLEYQLEMKAFGNFLKAKILS